MVGLFQVAGECPRGWKTSQWMECRNATVLAAPAQEIYGISVEETMDSPRILELKHSYKAKHNLLFCLFIVRMLAECFIKKERKKDQSQLQ